MARYWDQVLRTHFLNFSRFIAPMFFAVIFVLANLSLAISPAHAKSKYAGIVMDANSGRTLYSYRANEIRYPASLTKMMTLYLMFEALDQGKITKKTRIKMSKYAASKPPSKLGIRVGRTLSAEQAIYALVTKSANDVATAISEHLGGSEKNFAARMTNRAKQLGMRKTKFRNASGLTATGQITTARDMALLGIALREHYPKYYHYFSTRSFKYGKNRYGNHNRLLGRVKGVDGIKTGYTNLSGFNLVSSVQLNKRSIVAVVLGGKSGKSRNAQMQKLIASYLKKATRRQKSKLLVARIYSDKSSNSLTNAQVARAVGLPKTGPVPLSRPRNDDPLRQRIEQAHIASIAYASSVQPLSRSSIDAIRNKLLAMGAEKAPVPQQNPIASSDMMVTSAIRPKNPVGQYPVRRVSTITLRAKSGRVIAVSENAANTPEIVNKIASKVVSPAAANTPVSGWQVQIAAVPDRESALRLLSNIRKKMPVLADSGRYGSLSDYLQPVVKNGTQLYRARFAGFESKNSARSACRAMKKRKIACLAIRG